MDCCAVWASPPAVHWHRLVKQTGNLTQSLNTVRPVYTVPRNATLIGSTAMTALVGRVPVQGQVRDPMPFKVITGADNLAANGLTVPGVQGMVWSGTAIGDWTLSCVTGRLDSVTFVFEDGTIRTSPATTGNQPVVARTSPWAGSRTSRAFPASPVSARPMHRRFSPNVSA